MSIQNVKIIKENDQYRINLNEEKKTLIFSWKYIQGLSINDFKKGIAKYANACKEYKPQFAVIDATELDQNSASVAWLHGQNSRAQKEDYATWWMREIVPVYHDSGIVSLAVGTGDPNAAGELPNVVPGVKFKIGYFPDFEAALKWRVN